MLTTQSCRHGCVGQVAELTRIIEEDELFKYPEKDDLIGEVWRRARNATLHMRGFCCQ